MKNSFFTSTLLRAALLAAVVAVFGSSLMAQSKRPVVAPKKAHAAGNAEIAPAITNPIQASRPVSLSKADLSANKAGNQGGNGGANTLGTQAMWNVIDIMNLDSAAKANVALDSTVEIIVGICATNTEIWCSTWNFTASAASGKIIRFSKTGAYLGVHTVATTGFTHAGFRALTFDGTYMWGAISGSNNIRAIDTATRTVVGIVNTNAALSGGVRWATYDASANSNAGGFWVGNFATEIKLVNKPTFTPTPNPTTATTGAVLSTITAVTHGLGGMYGAAYDGTSPGGPYLWVNNQEDPFNATNASGAVIVQVQLPGGAMQPVSHDVETDLGVTPGASVAGGIGIFRVPNSTRPVIASIYQGLGDAVLYDLDFVYSQIFDVAATKVVPANGLTGWPENHSGPTDFNLSVRNGGNQTLTSIIDSTFIIDLSTLSVIDTLSGSSANLALGATSTLTRGSFVAPGQGGFAALAFAQTAGDVSLSNDTTVGFFAVTDTFFTRDEFDFNGFESSLGIGAGAGDEGKLAQVFTVAVDDTMSSITAIFVPDSTDAAWDPNTRDRVSFSVYSVTGAGVPDQLLGVTGEYEFQAGDATNGVQVTLPLLLALELPAGTSFAVAANEGAVNCGLFTTANIYTPGKHFVKWNSNAGGAWSSLEGFSAGLRRAFVLRPNFGKVCSPLPVDLSTIATIDNATCTGSNGSVTLDLSDAIFNGSTVVWSTGATGNTLDGQPLGQYVVTITLTDGCQYSESYNIFSTQVTLAAGSHVVTDNTSGTLPANGSITCVVSNGTAPYTYSWSNGATSQTISGLDKGTYNVAVTDANGCEGSFSIEVGGLKVGVEELANAGISRMEIAPNPSNGQFNLNVDLLNASAVNVEILDASGKVLFSANEKGSFSRNVSLEAAAGVYLVKVTTDKGTATGRVVIK